jgi:hypothetical protein
LLEEFAIMIEESLSQADDADLATEVQIEVLERIAEAMR